MKAARLFLLIQTWQPDYVLAVGFNGYFFPFFEAFQSFCIYLLNAVVGYGTKQYTQGWGGAIYNL